ncbi:MAG: ZIP family metal transporter [Solirubrobacterales bacterium]
MESRAGQADEYDGPMKSTKTRSRGRTWALALIPLILLAIALGTFSALDSRVFGLIGSNPPPTDELSVSRVLFEDRKIVVRVTNPQPDPIEIAVVTVDDGVANFSVSGGPVLDRFDRRSITIPFAWNEGEPYTIGITSSSGVQTTSTITAAVEAVRPNGSSILGFGLIGLLVGLLPVALGLMWLPVLRKLGDTALSGFMALTAGLLTFLAVDALFEAFEQQSLLPGSFGGIGLIVVGVSLSFIGVGALSGWLTRRARATGAEPGSTDTGPTSFMTHTSGFTLALAIAVGIGFHNFGEGLAIGAAFAIGELAFSSLLIVGFTVHNITEGLGIAVPIAEDRGSRPSLKRLAMLAAVAGLPAVLGTWIGGYFTSSFLATFFFAIAAGAAAQVVYEVSSFISRKTTDGWRSPAVAGGFVAGVAVMYLTGLIAG